METLKRNGAIAPKYLGIFYLSKQESTNFSKKLQDFGECKIVVLKV
ncbi:MAG: hypothetical protein HC764_25155 [Pleurocapsa sp. CRU_1_2]|nr:hypothetical protein [Pleurocapsa sp. CRU_1_2]